MTNNLEDEIRRIVASMEQSENEQPPDTNTQTPQDAIQDVYVLIVREHEEVADTAQVIDSTPPPATTHVASEGATPQPQQPQPQPFDYVTACIVLVCCLPILASIMLLVYGLLNPPIATVTIIPKTQHVTISGTEQLGRELPPITISQSQTVPTTGKGHQDAKQAQGELIYFNGSFVPQTVEGGTIYTGNDGIQVMTNATVTIPAATPGNPPQFGYATIGATAIQAGSRGNIPAGDIRITGTTLQVSNSQFHNGQDERSFNTVTQHDIHSISTVLKTTLASSITGALQGQLKQGEVLQLLPCSPSVTSDHQPGDEATSVKVTVSLPCSGIAYNTQELESRVTQLLTTQALKKLGTGYSLFGNIQVAVKQATITHNLVFLSFKASGMWVYGLSATAQERMKHLIAGKTTQEALHLLASLPGIEQVRISFHGFGDATKLPKTTGNIHVILIVM